MFNQYQVYLAASRQLLHVGYAVFSRQVENYLSYLASIHSTVLVLLHATKNAREIDLTNRILLAWNQG